MEEEIGQKGQNTFSDAVHFYSHKTYLDWIKKKFAVHVMEYSVQNGIFLTGYLCMPQKVVQTQNHRFF